MTPLEPEEKPGRHCVSGPVGVFDSGIGGLSVLRTIRQAQPHLDLFYVADTGYAPYGALEAEKIRQRSRYITKFLLSHGAEAIVVACNTATAIAVDSLRSRFDKPVVGIEPAIKPALQMTSSGRIGILATEATLNSPRFCNLLSRWRPQAEVLLQPCPDLVLEVEHGNLRGPRIRSLLSQYIHPLLDKEMDTLVLGCTHYFFLRPLLREITGPGVGIPDASQPVARQLERVLGSELCHPPGKRGSEWFWTSGEVEFFQEQLSRVWRPGTRAEALPESDP